MFKLDKNALQWGDGLIDKKTGPIKTDFDLYYIFLLVGLGKGRSEAIESGRVNNFTKSYPIAYHDSRSKIAALLLYSDLKDSGFEVDNRAIVKSKISKILSSDSQTFLSDEAIEKLNRYANGGYRVIKEVFPKAPHSGSVFLSGVYDEFLSDLF